MDDPGLALLAPTFSADPHPTWHRLRETHPVLHSPALQRWIVTGYEECLATLRSPDIGIGRDQFLAEMLARLGRGRAFDYVAHRLTSYDPPEHHRLRATVQGAFTGHRLDRLRDYIRAKVKELIPTGVEGPVDLLAQVAHPLPSLVICELLGLPEADRPAFDGWTRALAPLIGPAPSPAEVAAGAAAADEEWAYLTGWTEQRARSAPREDVTGDLLAAREAGRVSDDEIIATIMFLFSAGHQTTRDLIGNGLHALLGRPDQWAALCADPTAAPAAVTEMLRVDPPVAVTVRGVLRDTVVGGVDLPAGSGLIVGLAAGNRDPRRFPDPDRFELGRSDTRPLSFGGGAHHCLGAVLARMEAETVVRCLATDHPGLAPAYAQLEFRPGLTFRGPLALPVTLG